MSDMQRDFIRATNEAVDNARIEIENTARAKAIRVARLSEERIAKLKLREDIYSTIFSIVNESAQMISSSGKFPTERLISRKK